MKRKKVLAGGIAAALLAAILVAASASGWQGFPGMAGGTSVSCAGTRGRCCGAGRGGAANVPVEAQESAAAESSGVQEIKTALEPSSYPELTVRKGIPVKWTITADRQSLNFCNNEIVIPAYGISRKLAAGENTIEFTPAEAGVIPYSCWMGMIQSTITVVE